MRSIALKERPGELTLEDIRERPVGKGKGWKI